MEIKNKFSFNEIKLRECLRDFCCMTAKVESKDLYQDNIPEEYIVGVALGTSKKKELCDRAKYEAVEGFCLYTTNTSKISKFPANFKSENFLSTDECVLYSDIQEKDNNFPFSWRGSQDKIGWVETTEFKSGKSFWIPSHYIYPRKGGALKESLDGWSTSGGAFHINLKSAITNGALELIERDSLMCSWISRSGVNLIREDWSGNEAIRSLISKLEKQKIKTKLFAITNDLGIVTIMSLLISENRPYYSFGSSCRGDINTATEHALYESIMIRNTQHELIKYDLVKSARGLKAHILAPLVYDKSICSWMFDKDIKNTNLELIYKNHPEKDSDIVKLVTERFKTFFFNYDVSFLGSGFSVVKCAIPSLHPLEISSDWKHNDFKRVHQFVGHDNFIPNEFIHPFG